MFRIAEVLFDYCWEHSLWRTAGRKIRNILLVLVCDKLHPCRTAGSKKRKFLTLLNSVKELGTLFHNSKVSTEWSIINFIESHSVESIDNLTHNTLAFGQSIMITYCDTYCRSNLSNYTYIRISKCFPCLVHMCLDRNSTCWTIYTTLTAVYTFCLCDFFVKCRHYHGLSSPECKS